MKTHLFWGQKVKVMRRGFLHSYECQLLLVHTVVTQSMAKHTLVKSGVMKTKNMSYKKRSINSTVQDYNQDITNSTLPV